MLKIEFTAQFKRDYKLAKKRGCNPKKLAEVMKLLQNQISLPEKYKDHALKDSENFQDARECHIEPDWLLVYQVKEEILTLKMLRTGTHSDLF